ncbi:GNAT family protein [Haladaptatus sp. T7]|uniref:GNAT family N-acetyltransferase n=1 Tax=Haladaptatus sp. T7 TaxID=2029368 RepID=UPI00222EE273|nr:GNAT family protein [Haladaptatus sp. T7]
MGSESRGGDVVTELFPERIETERLVLERMCRENVTPHELYDLFSGPGVSEVFEHVPQSPYRTVNEPRELITNADERWSDGTSAAYAIRPDDGEPHADELAGTTFLFPEWERRTARFGLLLGKRFWGRGYSGERAAALLRVTFDRLDLELATVGHNVGNEKSRRAIEKYVEAHGGRHDCVLRNWVPMDDEIADMHRYTITREQYREATNA